LKSYDVGINIDPSELINTPTDLQIRETHDSSHNGTHQESRRFSNISSTIDQKKDKHSNKFKYTDNGTIQTI